MVCIFVSYSSKSKARVQALAQDLETAGHEIWFDHKLTGGQAWWDQILEQIRACDLFIFALTPEAMDSYPCKLEYTYAHDLGKNVLPVLLADGVSVNLLPPPLTAIQFVDYRGDDKQAAFRLMNALNHLPPARPLPDPLPTPPPVPISYIGNLKDQIDAPGAMTFEEQASLVFKLKEHLQNEDHAADAVALFRRLRKRGDLYARIAEEIDALLAQAEAPAAPPRAAPSPAPEVLAAVAAPSSPQHPSQQRTVRIQPAVTAAASADENWNAVVMVALVIGTFFIPFIGLVAGVIGLRSPAKRGQAIGLLVFGGIMLLFYGFNLLSEMAYYGYYF